MERFAEILKYPAFLTFFERFSRFVGSNYNDIISFYKGELVYLQSEIIEGVDGFIREYDRIVSLVDGNKNRLSSDIDAWGIIEMLDEVGVKLQTIKQTPKWLRSSIDIDFSSMQVIDGFIKSRQTIEGAVGDLGSDNPDKDWAGVAVQNTVYEEDYTYEGEKPLTFRVQYIVGESPINAVDIMVGDNILGKDLFKQIIFKNGDLKTLLPQETVKQSAELILRTFRGGISEFPNLGIDKLQASGNMNSLQFPSMFRQITEMFKQDDSFREVKLIDVSFEQDAFFMKFLIISRTGAAIEQVFRIFDDTFDSTFE